MSDHEVAGVKAKPDMEFDLDMFTIVPEPKPFPGIANLLLSGPNGEMVSVFVTEQDLIDFMLECGKAVWELRLPHSCVETLAGAEDARKRAEEHTGG